MQIYSAPDDGGRFYPALTVLLLRLPIKAIHKKFEELEMDKDDRKKHITKIQNTVSTTG